jgi:hypothetical protein
MVGCNFVLAFVMLLTAPVDRGAQASWLPPAVREGLANQLIERLSAIGPRQPTNTAAMAEGAGHFVDAVRAQLDTWTPQGVISRVPLFARVKLPRANERHLDAMARYQLCNLVLLRQFESADDDRDRQVGALGLTAVTMAVLALRQPFLAEGGRIEGVEAFLTSAEMDREASRIQQDPGLIAHVEGQCQPVVVDLLRDAF